MPEPMQKSGRYMAGLDGLRALAVIAVIAYHVNGRWAPGGLLGVGVFFVLSGYLITDILIAQWKRTGKVEFRPFWLRRARRLLPALLLMLVLAGAWILLFDRSRMASFREEMLAGLTYVSNWWLIFREVSYFESFGPPSPLGHLWSLAVEEQFYLLWPVLLLLGLKFAPRRMQLVGLTLAGAAVSAAAMAWLYEPGVDPSRVYYGTDTRAFGLLIGAVLAMVWPSRRLSPKITPGVRRAMDALGAAGLATIGLMVCHTDEYGAFLYSGGLLLLSLVAAVVVAVLAHPASRLAKLMSIKPLKWIGVRSYGIYLWHYPIIVLTSPAVSDGQVHGLRLALQLLATAAIAALSWRFVEEPIRRGAWRRPRLQAGDSRGCGKRSSAVRWTSAACALLLVGILSVGLLDRVATDATASSPASVEVSARPLPQPKPEPAPVKPVTDAVYIPLDAGPGATGTARRNGSQEPEPGQGQGDGGTAGSVPPSAQPGTPSGPGPAHDDAGRNRPAGEGITVIGDSVILDAASQLEKQLPGIVIDGKIGRQLSQAAEVVKELKKDGKLGKRVVVELGTNGAFTQEQLEALIDLLAGAEQIVLVNTRVPRKWESEVNDTLAAVAGSNPKVKLVDWYAASEGKPSLFTKDGVHLEPAGSKLYASLIVSALTESKS